MLLATRCPFCETVFRLQPAQLALRRGLVRCGNCNEVFDASSSLFDITEGGDFSSAKPVAAAAAIEALSGVRPERLDFRASNWDPHAPFLDAKVNNGLPYDGGNVPRMAALAGAAAPHRHVTDEPEFPAGAFTAPTAADDEPILADAPLDPFAYPAEPPAADAPRVWHKTERAPEPPVEEPLAGEPAFFRGIPDNEPRFGASGAGAAGFGAADPGAASGFGTAGTAPRGPAAAASGEPFSVHPVNDGVDPFPVVRETRPAEPRRVGWIIVGSVLAVLLIVALLAQLAWWQRETVQVYFPSSQALYVKACAQLGCQVTPPHDIDGLQVEPSDLRQIDGPHKLELKMPLRNRFNVALAYPAIELTLLDDQNNVAMRRVLWPQDYVAPGTPIAAGLPAHTTQTMIVRLDTGNAVASNFRVQIFYP
ncbi:zinc-ribbon and DUF3426 domain-containing protein [Paraburkholderia sp. DD10]|uniref:zinc-ribbon and DUF3426 domain-containing protein n=1 Tax=Paraburkholderia TaxID=1822464 RepID=UPI0009F6ABEC|nr:zinc-ribbon and DUF3426 domain-containing protein [Paraburkholderia terricola]AXE93600.1 DUF3426 domain-containing protein [Paraburkholderia terricola]ORC45161.1 hypothetical protein B2G74_31975 [Burkholderia sp. A27]